MKLQIFLWQLAVTQFPTIQTLPSPAILNHLALFFPLPPVGGLDCNAESGASPEISYFQVYPENVLFCFFITFEFTQAKFVYSWLEIDVSFLLLSIFIHGFHEIPELLATYFSTRTEKERDRKRRRKYQLLAINDNWWNFQNVTVVAIGNFGRLGFHLVI